MLERLLYLTIILLIPTAAGAQAVAPTIEGLNINVLVAVSTVVFVASLSWKLANTVNDLKLVISDLKREIAEERAPKKDVDKLWEELRDLQNDVTRLEHGVMYCQAQCGNTPTNPNIPVVRG